MPRIDCEKLMIFDFEINRPVVAHVYFNKRDDSISNNSTESYCRYSLLPSINFLDHIYHLRYASYMTEDFVFSMLS